LEPAHRPARIAAAFPVGSRPEPDTGEGAMRALLATIAMLVSLSLLSCATPQNSPGASGPPVTITPETAAYVQKYLATQSPLAFPGSADGTHCGYTWCEARPCQQYLEARSAALTLCSSAGGSQCRIIATWSKVSPYQVVPSQTAEATACLSRSYTT